MINIVDYESSYCGELAKMFYDTVHSVNSAVHEQKVERNGIRLTNYLMEKACLTNNVNMI